LKCGVGEGYEIVTWIEHRTNESILSEIDERRGILQTIRARRWNVIGLILRHENEPIYRMIEGKIEGKGAKDVQELYLSNKM